MIWQTDVNVLIKSKRVQRENEKQWLLQKLHEVASWGHWTCDVLSERRGVSWAFVIAGSVSVRPIARVTYPQGAWPHVPLHPKSSCCCTLLFKLWNQTLGNKLCLNLENVRRNGSIKFEFNAPRWELTFCCRPPPLFLGRNLEFKQLVNGGSV